MEETSATCNKIFTNVCGVPIIFNTVELNRILKIWNEGFQFFSSRYKMKKPWYNLVEVVRNICKRTDLSEFFCNAFFKAQVLPFQVRILYNIIQHFISIRTRQFDEVTSLDVCLLDSILLGRKLDIGYIILQHMFSSPNIESHFLPYGIIVTCILKHFNVFIIEPPLCKSKELSKEIIMSLVFEWNVNNDVWVNNRNLKNKPTEIRWSTMWLLLINFQISLLICKEYLILVLLFFSFLVPLLLLHHPRLRNWCSIYCPRLILYPSSLINFSLSSSKSLMHSNVFLHSRSKSLMASNSSSVISASFWLFILLPASSSAFLVLIFIFIFRSFPCDFCTNIYAFFL